MTRKAANPFAGLESGVAEAIKGTDGRATAVVDSVAGVYAAAVGGSPEAKAALLVEAPLLAESAVRGAAKAGADLASVARGFILGALRGGGLEGESALQAAGGAAGAFIARVGKNGGVAAAVMGLVEGAMVWANEAGQDATRAAAAAGQAAVDAAYALDAKTGREVREALRFEIAGVAIVLKERAKADG
jgi:hypothetical protein